MPGSLDGRAPLACCTVKGGPTEENLAAVLAHARRSLASYQVPVFLRLLPADSVGDTTGTFKHRKVRFRKEGCDPGLVAAAGDRLFWLRGGAYTGGTRR